MYRMRALLLTSAAFGCLTLSCGKKTVDDQALTTGIQAKLYADPVTKPANVNVSVSKGVVTLNGDVPSSDVELEAMKIANGTPGVASVTDQMKVNPSLAASEPQRATSTPPPAAGYPPVSAQPAPASQTPAPQTATEPVSPPAPPPPAASPARAVPAPTPVPAIPAAITIAPGARVSVRMIDSIDSRHNTTGQVFRASLEAPIVSRGRVVVPAGNPVSVLLAEASRAGHIEGRSELEVRVSALEYRGRNYPVTSSIYEEAGKARGKQSAVRTGVGAVSGAVIGAIAGGGKGAAIGTVAGGGAGAGYQLFTHGQQVKIPSESVLSFRLEAPLTLQERR